MKTGTFQIGRRQAAWVLALVLAITVTLTAVTGCQELVLPEDSLSDGSSVPVSGESDSSGDASDPAETATVPALCIYAGDSLDPYLTVARNNLDLASLLYDGLTVLDADGVPTLALAASLEQTEAGVWQATLRADAVFSDGSPVTARDVCESFRRAKASDNYAARLIAFRDAEPIDRSAVRLTQSDIPTPCPAACLSFPIQKCGGFAPADETSGDASDGASGHSAEESSAAEPPAWDADWVPCEQDAAAAVPPIGTGRYVFTPDASGCRLTDNPADGRQMNLPTLALVSAAGETAMLHALESGTVQLVYSDSGELTDRRTTEASVSVALTELIYLGIDLTDPLLRQPAVRQALSFAIDREGLCSTAFNGYARAIALPWTRAFGGTETLPGASVIKNIGKSLAKWAEAGYNTSILTESYADDTVSAAAKPLSDVTLELLYCSDREDTAAAASWLAEQLSAVGIQIRLSPEGYAAYGRRVRRGDYDLYLGDVRLTPDGSLAPFFERGGAAAVRGIDSTETARVYAGWCAGTASREQVAAAFAEELPFVPLCGRYAFAAYSRRLTGVAPTAFDLYADVEHWSFM